MDNQLMEINNFQTIQEHSTLTMSSREIAKLCNKRHDHVMRDITKMLEDLYSEINAPKFGAVKFEGTYLDKKGESRPCYHLPKRECLILVSGYSATLRAKIVDRWLELEQQPNTANITEVLNNPDNLKALLLDNVNKVIKLQEIVKEQEPKVKALEHLTRADGLLCITDTAKVLNMRPKDLFQYLQKHNWIYKRASTSNFIPYQDKLKSGLMDCPTTTIHRPDGSEKIIAQAKITTKGLATLSAELQQSKIIH